MKKILTIIFILFIGFSAVFAEDKPAKTVTRAEIVEKLSTSDFLKKKIGDLLNWSIGYDITKINRTNLAPTISYIVATPLKVPPDERTVVLITAKVSDPKGPDNIKGVRADLSSINRLPNMMLVDNGLWGDKVAGDGIYTLQTNVGYDVVQGSKDIPVAVANKAGWVAVSNTNLNVETNPVIYDSRAIPEEVQADGRTQIMLIAKVENPGRNEDIKEVSVDLSPIGGENGTLMWDDGTHGDVRAGDKVYTTVVTVKTGTASGIKRLPVKAVNNSNGEGDGEIILKVE
jgi:hypothetical protein